MTATAPATTPDYDAIVRVVHLYVDGYNHDIAMLREAFHEDAWIFFTEADGTLEHNRIWDELEEWVAGPDRIVGHVLAVTQAGDVASVLLRFEGESAWIDVLALLRIDGVWKITNKTATHVSRAGWAGAAARTEG